MSTISLVMIVKNEEKKLERCLQSARHLVDEIVIVDTGSSDLTKQIAYSYQAMVYDYGWVNDFSSARNFALEQSNGDWNLILDADEYIMNDCGKKLKQFISQGKSIGRVKRIDEFFQDGELKRSQSFLSRLIPRGVRFTGSIHEQVVSDMPRVNVEIEIFHDGYIEDDKTERNLNLLIRELEKNPSDAYMLYQTGKQFKLMKAFGEAETYFIDSYNRGNSKEWYSHSLVIDLLYTNIATKNFQAGVDLINMERERFTLFPDFHFVCGLFFTELIFSDVKKYSYIFPNIEQMYLECMKIGETNDYDSVLGVGSFLPAYNLGVLYELMGQIEKAVDYYQISSVLGYKKAKTQLESLNN